MKEFKKQFQSIWANLDPNGHMRHTAYNDYAAQLRLSFFDEMGFPFNKLMEMYIGPVLFREETRFLREIRMGEKIEVGIQLLKARPDGSKWSFVHNIYKIDGTISAIIEVDGAWLDLQKRKIIVPPSEITEMLTKMPRAENFEWLPEKKTS
jgi:acyl-CoA thioester hydrolase